MKDRKGEQKSKSRVIKAPRGISDISQSINNIPSSAAKSSRSKSRFSGFFSKSGFPSSVLVLLLILGCVSIGAIAATSSLFPEGNPLQPDDVFNPTDNGTDNNNQDTNPEVDDNSPEDTDDSNNDITSNSQGTGSQGTGSQETVTNSKSTTTTSKTTVKKITCSLCKGTGVYIYYEQTKDGTTRVSVPCTKCGGKGYIYV